MTEEMIKQNAEGYYDKLDSITIEVENEPNSIVDAYITGAHSRDKEIKELEKEVFGLKLVVGTAKATIFTQETIIKQLRNPWIDINEKLPIENQDVLIVNWQDIIIRKESIGIGDINYIKENPKLYKCWMLTPKPN